MSVPQKTFRQKVLHELKSIAATTLYFALWLGVLMLLKKLTLADYQIQFSGISITIISALIIAKVVILMELIPLGGWVRQQPAIVDVVLRTLLYTLGVLIVFLLEKAFESRHEAGGFGTAILNVFHHRDIYHVWTGTIVIGLSILWYNVLSVVRQYFGNNELRTLFFSIPLSALEGKQSKRKSDL